MYGSWPVEQPALQMRSVQSRRSCLRFRISSSDDFLEQIELRANAKEAGLVDGEIFEERGEFLLAFAAGEQPVVAVERIQLAGLQAALQTVAKEMRAALVEIHAALLIDQRLQELQFGFGERNLCCECGHSFLEVLCSRARA